MAELDKEMRETMKILLQESDYAFSITMQAGGNANTDFADYTSNHFIRSFRHILQKPDLSRAQLASMLRQAERQKRQQTLNNPNDSWADLVTGLVSQNANTNEPKAIS
jgi:hypothetical protein